MKEVFGAAPGEGFIEGLLPDGVEKLDCLAVCEDIEEAQKFPVDAAGSRQKGREERFVDIRGLIVKGIRRDFFRPSFSTSSFDADTDHPFFSRYVPSRIFEKECHEERRIARQNPVEILSSLMEAGVGF